MSDDLRKALEECGRAWNRHCEAIERMNAARPDVLATQAERALYAERYQASQEASRDMRWAAQEVARLSGQTLTAPASSPPLITEEMVERGARAVARNVIGEPSYPVLDEWVEKNWSRYAHDTRVILTAALASPEALQGDKR